jgi:hypothetical protein
MGIKIAFLAAQSLWSIWPVKTFCRADIMAQSATIVEVA